MIGNISDSLTNFQKAMEYANEESDLEAYVLTLCQMSISFLFNGNLQKFKEFSNEFYEKNSSLKHPEMEMEMLMVSGFIHNYIKDYQKAFYFYSKALDQANLTKNEYYKAACLSNIGVINSSSLIDEEFEKLAEDQYNFENDLNWQNETEEKVEKSNSNNSMEMENYNNNIVVKEENDVDFSEDENNENIIDEEDQNSHSI